LRAFSAFSATASRSLRFNAFEKRTLLEFTAEEYLSRSAKERKQKEPAEEQIHTTKNKI
jgi:hypothetical protein